MLFGPEFLKSSFTVTRRCVYRIFVIANKNAIINSRVFVKAFDTFLQKEGAVLQEVRSMLQWHVDRRNPLKESDFQAVFHLYLRGLIHEASMELTVSAANRAKLSCKVIVNGSNVELSGFTDIRVGKDVESSSLLAKCDDKIGELKLFGGKLEDIPSCNAARDQLLGQLFTLNNMRSSPRKSAVTGGFLTDLKRIMIVLGGKKPNIKMQKFAISSSVQELSEYICHLLFLTGITEHEIGRVLDTQVGAKLAIDTDDAGQNSFQSKLSSYAMSKDISEKSGARKGNSGKKSGKQNKGSQLRALQVIDLNAGDREEEREECLRQIYEHDALCRGFAYLSQQNLENHSSRKAHSPYI